MAKTLRNRYSEIMDAKRRATLVTVESGPVPIFNTKYQGDPKAGSVYIPTYNTEANSGAYNKATGLAIAATDNALVQMLINKDFAVNELIDGYDAAAVPGNIIADRLDSAGYVLAKQLDKDGILTLEAEGTTETSTTALTSDTIFGAIVDSNVALDEANIPRDGRFGIYSPKVYALLIKDKANFVKASDMGQDLVMMGFNGMVDGVPFKISNQLVAGTEYIIGHGTWCHRVEDWVVDPVLVDLTLGSPNYVGASAVKGRKVYGHKVSQALAVRVKTKV